MAEGLRDDIRMIADGVVSLHVRVDAHRAETTGVLANHEGRLTRLETSRPKRRQAPDARLDIVCITRAC